MSLLSTQAKCLISLPIAAYWRTNLEACCYQTETSKLRLNQVVLA